MTTLEIYASAYAAGAFVALAGLAFDIRPRNRDGWLVVASMALLFPLTFVVLLVMWLRERRK